MKVFISMVLAAALALPLSAQHKETGSSVGPRRMAVVELSVNFMREIPEYEAENGDQSLMGTVVEIVNEKDYWRQIITPEPYKAWVNEMGLVEMSEQEIENYLRAEKYICTADYSHIYREADSHSERISDAVMGCIVRVSYDSKGRAEKKGKYVGVLLPSGRKGWMPSCDVENFRKWADSAEMTESSIVNTARLFMGVPYMWGGTSIKAVDCSGLARCVYFMNGILLPRNASQQARVGEEVEMNSLRPGDLLFFGTAATQTSKERISHVGIYIGDNQYIHSSQKVRISSLDKESSDYAGRDPLRARRILGHVNEGSGIISMKASGFYFPQN